MAKNDFKIDLLPTIYEFLIIILPVSIYVGLEAIHKDDLWYFLKSPEWSIASIFLSFQASALYLKGVVNSEKRVNDNFLGFLFLLVIIVTVAATVNAYVSLDYSQNTTTRIITRIVLLVLSTLSFFVLVLSSKSRTGHE